MTPQLLQQALDALRQCEFTSPPAQRPIVKDAIAALREALAAPMPELDNDDVLWLWKDGEHFLAYRHLYPCYSPGGDPMTLGEPFGKAIFRHSHDRSTAPRAAPPAAPAPAAPVVREPQPEPVQRLMRFAGKKRSEVSNPCLTAREAIVIADWMQAHGITGGKP